MAPGCALSAAAALELTGCEEDMGNPGWALCDAAETTDTCPSACTDLLNVRQPVLGAVCA